ncbi:amino acid adenylation domain-containing protein [Pseudomonas aeruginosa]|nr:amino acid adenylation domain-containing protein [Pseudomonas aeruginosa]
MNAEDSLKLARRFIELPVEKRRVFLETLRGEGIDFSLFPIPAGVSSAERDRLSYAQQRMWFLWHLEPQSGAYNLPSAVRLNGPLDRQALERAFASLVQRHETLRTVFPRGADDSLAQAPLQRPLEVAFEDCSGLPEAEQEARLREEAQRESLQPFDLCEGPLLRVRLIRLGEERHVLLLTLHHIVSDGWSMNVLIEEFSRFYSAYATGAEPGLPALPIQYADYALWQRSWLEAGEQERQLEYWRGKLGERHPVLELPTDHPRPAVPSYRGSRYEFSIEPALAEALRGTARRQGLTLFMLLLGGFNILLQRYSGQTDLRVGVPIANRNRAEVEGLIGLFVNTQVLRSVFDGRTSVATLLAGLKDTVLGAQAHQDLPFERLVEAFKVERSLSHSPLFQVMYNHQPLVADIEALDSVAGLSFGQLDWKSRTTQFDLSLDTYEKGGRLYAALTYATDLFEARTVERMARHWQNLLRGMLENPQASVDSLPMLDAEERYQLLEGWNATAAEYPLQRGVHRLFEEQVERTPTAPALAFGEERLDYAELNRRANRLAHALIERGVGADRLVGVAMERSIEMVVALMAILKAGGAYVPVDPEYPEERQAYMLEDSGVELLLSQSHLKLPLAQGVQRIDLDQADAWLENHVENNPGIELNGENLAYVIYTSGSTGKPKGAGNRHSALSNRLCWMQQAYGLGVGDSLTLQYSYDRQAFSDAAVEQLDRHLLNLLEGFVDNAERTLVELSLLDAEERALIDSLWNRSESGFPASPLIHQRVAERARLAPDAPAVLFDDQVLSFAELDSRANRLAHALIARGVGPEVRVAIAMQRSAEIMIAFLAVLKSGGAYVPLDIEYPRERLLYMMQDSRAHLLLTQNHLLDRLPIPDGLSCLCLDREQEWAGFPAHDPEVALHGDNLAYVIYTSGSTGMPKGVAVSHGPLAAHIVATGERYEMTPADCELHFMSFAFDGSHEGWMHPLINGARVLIRDDSLWLPEQTYAQMHRHGVTVAVFPPVYLQQLAEHAERDGNPPAARVYCFGGDAVAQASYDLAWRALRPQYLFNGYGPTETVVTPLLWKARPDDPCGAAYMPIGTLLGNRSGYILDAQLNLLPVGVAGELYLGGEGVARGYLERPALTAERFVPDPFGAPGSRLYRSGDLTRGRADGVVDYLGRVDHQVKIRGFRIELGEIEARLREQAAVREAVVVAQAGASGQQLVGYVVPHDPALAEDVGAQAACRDALRKALKERLPEYMLPAHLLFLACMPLTPNGKLDRKGLPKPSADQQQRDYQAPRSEVERQLATIWAEVLKLEQVGLADNFFEIGGDSIISLQVVSRARQLGIHFTPKMLFEAQTIGALAPLAESGTQVLAIDQGPVTGVTPLLPIQQGFFAEKVAERHWWNQSVLLEAREPLDARLLEQALRGVLAHHDALRLSFTREAAGWTARHRGVEEGAAALLRVARVADLAALRALADEVQRSLDLADGPLLRALLATFDDGSQRLLLVIHHLVVDGVSWRILFEDLQTAYRQLLAGQTVELPAKTSAFRDWAERLQAFAGDGGLDGELAYWQGQLQGASSDLPCLDPLGDQSNRHARSVSCGLDAEATRQLLQEAPAAYRTQVNDLLLTALARVICRWTGQVDALIQLEGHGREELFAEIDLTRTVGWFTSLFPLRLTPAEGIAASIKGIKEQLRAVPNKGIGFGALRYLGSAASQAALAGLPVPRITFNYLGQFDGSFAMDEGALFVPAGERAGDDQSPDAPLANWLALNGRIYGGELRIDWSFSGERFETTSIQRLADAYRDELLALIAHCRVAEGQGLTPSDFPLARLDQARLDQLPLAPCEVEDLYPLSPMQQGMLFHSLYQQEAGDYINQLRVDIDGLHPESFRAAWQAALDEHDVLRSGFLWQGAFETPLQVVRKRVEVPFSVLDWRGREDLAAALDELAAGEGRLGFDLSEAPLLRLVLVRTDEERYHLIYTNHHILMDGWSNSQLLGEVLQRYRGETPPRSGGRYRDYIAWLQRQDAALAEAFWLPRLRQLDEPTRLGQSIAQARQRGKGYAERLRELDGEQTRRLAELAREQKITVNTLVQAAWLMLLQRYTGQDSVAFGATVAGRPAELNGIEEQIGLFINTLPVIASPLPQQSLASWLQAVQGENLALREFEHTPLYDIQRWAGQGGEALFDNILVFENYPVSQMLQQQASQGLAFGAVGNHEQTNYPLTLSVSLGQRLELQFAYDREHFDDASVARLDRHLTHLLAQMVERPASTCLAEFQLLEAAERRQAIFDWGRNPGRYPDERSVEQLFASRAAMEPERVALLFEERQLSYGELNAQANRLAHRLIELGVGPDVLVGIAVERGLEMIVSLLAVLKAGGAYVPLDPEYPQERLGYMIEDSGIALLLSQSHLLQRLPAASGIACLALDQARDWQDRPASDPQLRAHPQNLAYVMFTSGSTGRPKGVGISRESLSRHTHVSLEFFGIGPDDRVLQFSTFNFDGFVEQLYPPLACGASVVLRGTEIWDSETLYREIVERRITTVDLTTAYWNMLAKDFANQGVRDYGALRQVHAGGEAMPPESLVAWKAAGLEHVRLLNTYGPTEATVTVTTLDCAPYVDGSKAIPATMPIGKVLPGRAIYLLDDAGQPAPVGAVGELVIGAELLARGYFKRPDLTAARFIPDPFDEQGGGRLYRTGDLARYGADGVIEYVGRVDHQVKVRGFRIELGEIEACLGEHPAVREALVIAVEGAAGAQLVAYLVPQAEALASATLEVQAALRNELKALLRDNLPEYMVPAHLLFLERLPLSPNGKVDRKALPAPDASLLQEAYVAPRSELECQVAAIWQEVLKLQRVGLDDHFFELGGHSLLAINVISRIQLELGMKLTPQLLFQFPTLGLFVSNLEKAGGQVDTSKLNKLEALLDEMEEV